MTMEKNDFTTTTSPPTNETYDHVCYNMDFGPAVILSYRVEVIWSMVSVIVGLIGNSLNIVVFSSKEMRTMSSNVYLLNLAVSDSMYLVTVFLAKILTAIRCLYFFDNRFDIYNTNDVMCRLLQYMLDHFSDYSAMMILAFTVERYIACYHAIKFKEICSVKRAWIICISIFVVIALTTISYHMTCMGLHPEYLVCTVNINEPMTSVFFYAYIVEMLIYRVIPVIIIAVLNVFIIVKILNVHEQRKRRHTIVHINGKRSNSQKLKTQKDDKHIQLTFMLILVSTAYIVLLIPNMVYFIISRFTSRNVYQMDPKTELIFKNYTSMFFISAFAVNFFLYTMSGKVFRDQLKLIVCKKVSNPDNKNSIKKASVKNSSVKDYKNGKVGDESVETLI